MFKKILFSLLLLNVASFSVPGYAGEIGLSLESNTTLSMEGDSTLSPDSDSTLSNDGLSLIMGNEIAALFSKEMNNADAWSLFDVPATK